MQGDEAVIVIISGTNKLDEGIRRDQQVQRRFSVIRPRAMTVHIDGPDFTDRIAECCR